MGIITISRGSFAGGLELAGAVATRLGYRSISREDLYARVEKDHAITPDQAAELLEDAPASRAEMLAHPERRRSLGAQRRRLFASVQAALCDHVGDDGVVYHGLAGHLLLPGVPHVLRVRFIAPRAKRLELAIEREGLTRTAASRKIDQVDNERNRWTQAFFGVAWGDPLLFDLVINQDQITIDEATDIVVHAAGLPRFALTPAGAKRLRDLGLASHVAARLLAQPPLADAAIDVQADDGAVRVLGVADALRRDVSQLVRATTGVKAVTFETN